MFKKGKLVFINSLLKQSSAENNVPYFTARALVITEKNGQFFGTVETLKISDLILKASRYVYDGLNSREAHKLYTWPANLGDMNAWAESKNVFLEQHVMNFPIRILSVENENQITWEFASPADFKNTPADLQASQEFQEYLDHQEDWYFLSKDRNDPV